MSATGSPASSSIEVTVDSQRHLLRIRFSGVVTAAAMADWANRVDASLLEVGPDFTLVTDLTDLLEMEIDSVAHLTRVMDRCLLRGVKQVVRVIPDPAKDIGFHLLSMTHYRGRVPISTHLSRADAERALAGA